MISREKILLLGSGGSLGNYLFNRFEASQYSIICYNKKVNSYKTFLEDLNKIYKKYFFSIIINCIAATDLKKCEFNRLYSYNGNVLPLKVINDFCEEKNNTFLIIHFSTDQIYSGNKRNEESKNFPINEYGRSKLIGEDFIKEKACIFRTNYLWRGSKYKVSYTDWIYNTSVNKIDVKIFRNIIFNPIYPDIIYKAVLRVLKGYQPCIFNLGCVNSFSKADFYEDFTNLLNISNSNANRKDFYPIDSIDRPLNMVMDVKKAIRAGFYLPEKEEVLLALVEEYKCEN